MIYLKYRGEEVNQYTYSLEYIQDDIFIVEWFSDYYAYAKALIRAYDLSVDGYIVYCLTRNRIKIVNGFPVRRGRKPKNESRSKIDKHFTPQLPEAPEGMQSGFFLQ
jgi:hypothetical protein